MDPSIWEPINWNYLNIIVLNYPKNPTKQQKKLYIDFINSLPHLLPSLKYKKIFLNEFNKLPVRFYVTNNETLINWLSNIHNNINKKLNRKQENYRSELIYNLENIKNDKSIKYYKNKNKIQKFIIIILLIIIFTLYFHVNII